MTSLKTLKDFEDKDCHCWFPPFYLEDQCKKKRAIPEDLLKSEAVEHYFWACKSGELALANWIKHFFNLTEKDLE